MKARTILLFAITFFLFMGVTGCEKDTSNLLKSDATINFADPAVDGCGWSVSIDGVDYHPTNLDDKFKVDELNVYIEYYLLETNYECGFGMMQYLSEIEIVKIRKR